MGRRCRGPVPDPACDGVEEVAVVGHDQDGAFVIDQVLLQPCDGFSVQVVGRLIEEQHVRRFSSSWHRATRRASPPDRSDVRVIGWAAQRFHRDVDLAVEIPKVFGVDLILQLAHLFGGLIRIVHRQVRCSDLRTGFLSATPSITFSRTDQGFVQLWLLGQVANFGALSVPRFAGKVFVHARHDLHQRGFTRSRSRPTTPIFTPGRKFR